jgi:TetR/AcrR family transcriptional regulator, mexJK operon transcriptional repressor
MDNAPEQAIAERLREFDRRGWIDAPDPLLATDHFLALAFSTAVTMSRHARATGTDDVRTSVVNGVRAFLRAYPPKSSISNSDSET